MKGNHTGNKGGIEPVKEMEKTRESQINTEIQWRWN